MIVIRIMNVRSMGLDELVIMCYMMKIASISIIFNELKNGHNTLIDPNVGEKIVLRNMHTLQPTSNQCKINPHQF